MKVSGSRLDRRLGAAAAIAGLVEMAFSLIMGIGRWLPLFGAVALVLGITSLTRTTAERPTRWIAIAAVSFAALGVAAVVLLLWFLAHVEFTF